MKILIVKIKKKREKTMNENFSTIFKKTLRILKNEEEFKSIIEFFDFFKGFFQEDNRELIDNISLAIEYYLTSNNFADFEVDHFLKDFQVILSEARREYIGKSIKQQLFEKIVDNLKILLFDSIRNYH